MRLQMIGVAAVVALTAVGCERGRQADETAARPETTQQDQTQREQMERQEETTQLERRVEELEREWNDVRQNLTDASAEARKDVEERISRLREEIAELRTTNETNWWDRYEQRLERAANEVEQDVRRFARRWTPGEREDEVGTTGNETGWEARRDRLVSRLEARIEEMERALRDNETGRRDERQMREMNDTRERIGELRDDTDRLRNASEDDWWDITRDRVNDFIERTEAAINRLATGTRNEPARNRS